MTNTPGWPTIYVEKVGMQAQFVKEARKACPPGKIKSVPLPKSMKKADRIVSLLDPFFNTGRLHVRREALDALRVEADTYYGGKDQKDDVLDAMSLLASICKTGGVTLVDTRGRI